jgi:hypothetical protein
MRYDHWMYEATVRYHDALSYLKAERRERENMRGPAEYRSAA